MNNKIFIIIGVVLFGTVVFGWYSTAHRTQKPIVIGATLALSGNYAYLGEAERDGVQLALDEINKEGGVHGRPLVLVAEDNTGDAKTAVSGVIKLLTVDNADIIISAFTHITTAVKDLVQEKDKVMIYASTSGDIAKQSLLFFRDYYDAAQHGQGAADLVMRIGAKNIAVLSEQSDQCVLYVDALKQGLTAGGVHIVDAETYLATEKDFKTILLKIKSAKPDAIALCSWRSEQYIMPQLKDLGMLATPTVHWVGPFLPAADTDAMRQIFSDNHAVSTWYGYDVASGAGKAFADAYQKRFGLAPVADAAYAYDDIHILAHALGPCTTADTVDEQCLARGLSKTDYTGASGRVTFDANRASNRAVLFIKAEDGKWGSY
jgi:branched-chain amino acid transport system substrate-binding protein